MDRQSTGRALGIARICIGVALTVAPGRAGRNWLGDMADKPAGAAAVRSLGVRDLALGVGLMRSVDTGTEPRPWLLAGAAADAADVAATLIAWKHLPSRGRLLTVALAGASTVVGLRAANQPR